MWHLKVAENPVTFKVDKPGIQADRLLHMDPALLTSCNKSTPPLSYHHLTIDTCKQKQQHGLPACQKPHPPALADREPLNSLQQKSTLATLHAKRTVWRVATGESCQVLPPSSLLPKCIRVASVLRRTLDITRQVVLACIYFLHVCILYTACT